MFAGWAVSKGDNTKAQPGSGHQSGFIWPHKDHNGSKGTSKAPGLGL